MKTKKTQLIPPPKTRKMIRSTAAIAREMIAPMSRISIVAGWHLLAKHLVDQAKMTEAFAGTIAKLAGKAGGEETMENARKFKVWAAFAMEQAGKELAALEAEENTAKKSAKLAKK